jgi:hypothetical protein
MNLPGMTVGSGVIAADVLWFLVFVGWVILLVVGLEADKPLSGGIPGHVDLHETRMQHHWSLRDKIGEIGGWAAFAAVSTLLPVILYWIFVVHDK